MQMILTAATVAACTGLASASTENPLGIPGDVVAPAPVQPQALPGLTDAGLPLVAGDGVPSVLAAAPESEDSTARGENPGVGPMPASSTLRVELVSDPSSAALALATQAENAWSRGDTEGVDNAMRMLEQMGELVGGAYSYAEPVSAGRAFGEGIVKTSGVNIDSFDFNFDPTTGNLFAVVDDGTTWSMHISTDNGATWSQTFSFGTNPNHVDMAIVDGFVYVGYSQASSPTQARLRRFSTVNGLADAGYFFQTIFNAPAGQQIDDIALEGNEDSFNNRIFYAVLQSDGALRWAFDQPADGTTFAENSTNGVTNAVSNLDMHWDTTTTPGAALHLCYVNALSEIRHIKFLSSDWSPTNSFIASHDNGQVRIAAEQDTVIIGYISDSSGGTQSTDYRISYDDGVSWNVGGLNNEGSTDIKYSPDVAARLDYGTALTYNAESGLFDPALIRRRAGYAPGVWGAEATVNVTDLVSGCTMRVEALPTISSGAPASYGVMFETFTGGGDVRFGRIENCTWLGDVDNDGDVELDDLLTVLANFGTFNSVGDTNDDDFVDLADLLTVLADFGNDCSNI